MPEIPQTPTEGFLTEAPTEPFEDPFKGSPLVESPLRGNPPFIDRFGEVFPQPCSPALTRSL